jgi:hypothetical protein
VAKFPYIVLDADTGEPALWQHNAQVGRVSLRFRTQELAQAAADQLRTEQRKK